MFELKEWNEELDLTDFYKESLRKGFVNNSSQKRMIDCFRNEPIWNAWILYYNNKAIGSVAAHSFFDVMGEKSYRILTRTCSFAEYSPLKGLITPKKLVAEHQNFTDQFFVPKCVEWVGSNNRMFATSNESTDASQKLVHKYYFPTLEKKNLARKVKQIFYRDINQTVWEIYPKEFLTDLEKYPKWN
jgi:hypothetical protein